ncbi:MAG TPA: response regulator [Trichocoleus sp.]
MLSGFVPTELSPQRTLPLEDKWVLVVEDEIDSTALFTLVFELAGAEVFVASSLDEALRVLNCFIPDAVVSNLLLPDGNGCALAEHLRFLESEVGRPIPAIALSAETNHFYQEWALSAGFQNHLLKPLDPSDLVKAVISAIQKHPSSTDGKGSETNSDRSNFLRPSRGLRLKAGRSTRSRVS